MACVLQKSCIGEIYFRCYFQLNLAATIDEMPSVGKLHFGEADSGRGCKGVSDSLSSSDGGKGMRERFSTHSDY